MKAVVYEGPFKVAVKDVPEPAIQGPNDAIIKITASNICGSDLHMYEGRKAVEEGKILGLVEEVGARGDQGPAR